MDGPQLNPNYPGIQAYLEPATVEELPSFDLPVVTPNFGSLFKKKSSTQNPGLNLPRQVDFDLGRSVNGTASGIWIIYESLPSEGVLYDALTDSVLFAANTRQFCNSSTMCRVKYRAPLHRHSEPIGR
jgi:hypothetical protein